MTDTNMRAAVYDRYGPPGVVTVREVPRPKPGPGEVLVRVAASTVCAADWRFRRASPSLIRLVAGLVRPKQPILGQEFSGTITRTGAGVTRFAPGDQVFGNTDFALGAHAEYLVMRADGALALKPANLPLTDSAALSFGGLTALTALRRANIAPGDSVVVYGASGSVGVCTVQIAKARGARVTAVTSAANADLLRSLGADDIIDYARTDFAAAGRVHDAVIDTVGKAGAARSLRALKRGGVFVQIGPDVLGLPREAWARLTGAARVVRFIAQADSAGMEELRALAESGHLRPVIERRFALDDIAAAHALAESGRKKGHALVVIAASLDAPAPSATVHTHAASCG